MALDKKERELDRITLTAKNNNTYGSNKAIPLDIPPKGEDIDDYFKEEKDHIRDCHLLSTKEDPDLAKSKNEVDDRCALSKNDVTIMVMCCLVEFLTQVFLSLLGPFFTRTAELKGIDSLMVGCTFCMVPLFQLLASPFFGSYLKVIGAKFLFVTGVMSLGYCNIVFGFVDWIHNPTAFVILCLLVRSFEGIATAAINTTTYAIIAYKFPNRLAFMSAVIEVMSGIGYTAGPPLGGLLFELGGFITPFVITGSLVIVVGLVTCICVPSIEGNGTTKHKSRWPLLLNPLVFMALLTHMAGILVLAFLTSRTGAWLECEFGTSPLRTGVIFLASALSYLVASVVFGLWGQKFPTHGPLFISAGYMMAAVGVLFMGPPPISAITDDLKIFIPAMVVGVFGLSANLISFQILGTQATKMYGQSLQLSGWIGGVITISLSLGEFLGPLLAGFLQDLVGFKWSCVIFALFLGTLAILQYLVATLYNLHQKKMEK